MIKAARATATAISKPAIDAAAMAAPAPVAKAAPAAIAKAASPAEAMAAPAAEAKAAPAVEAKAAPAPIAKAAPAPEAKAAAAAKPAPASKAPAVKHVVQFTEEELPVPPAPAAKVEEDKGDERRRSPRQALAAKGFVRSEDNSVPGWKVDMVNISMLGIRFRSTRALEPGERASVKMELGPLRWSSKLKVVHCDEIDPKNYSIGCEFVANELSRPMARAA